jgi:hypothetical protein
MYRREFVIGDEARVLVALSDSRKVAPSEFLVYEADLSKRPDTAALIRSLAASLWPSLFSDESKGERGSDVRWSTTNHRRITRDVLTAFGFGTRAVSLVEEGNVFVDRLSNQFNNPQHSMRNLGQTLAEAQREASEWIASRRKLALSEAYRGNMCCALFSAGQALHTIQDRKHNWIFLYQHLLGQIISDFWHQYAPEQWERAHRETREWCVEFLNEVQGLVGPAIDRLKQTQELKCSCGGVNVDVTR